MTRTEYRALPGLNFSTAKFLLRSPQHYRHAKDTPIEPTDEMKLGTWVHEAFLEDRLPPVEPAPETLDGKKWTIQRNDCKEYVAAKEARGIEIVSRTLFSRYAGMVLALKESKMANRFKAGCSERESAAQANIDGGLLIKGLLDGWGVDRNGVPFIVDLKTTDDASPNAFAKTIVNRDYDLQAVWYMTLKGWLDRNPANGTESATFCWIAVENKAPFTVQCYLATYAVIASGRHKMAKVIRAYQKGIIEGFQTGYSNDEILPIGIPGWAYPKEN